MRFIIDFADSATDDTIAAYLKEHNCEIAVVFDQLGKIYVVDASAEPPVTDIIQAITRDDEHGITLLDQHVTIHDEMGAKLHQTMNDDNWWKLAVVPNIDLDSEEFETRRVGHGVRVYLVDSGIDISHPEFKDKDVTLLYSNRDSDFTDTTGHGTALASIIVGETCGLTEASLRVVKIFHKDQTTYVSDILAAFNAVAKDFSDDPLRAAVLNLSWSIPKNPYVEEKINILIQMGMIVSVAAGNSGVAVSDVTPAGMAEVETVGSFGPDLIPSNFSDYTGDAHTSYTAEETNSGPGLDLFAPGEEIRSASVGGGFGYTVGTSAAAAVYSAVLASEIARTNPNYDRWDYEKTLFELRLSSRMRDLLVLSGKFVNSPNVTPRTAISTAEVPLHQRYSPLFLMIPAGQKFAVKLFDYAAYAGASITGEPADWTLTDNYMTGTAAAASELTNGVLRTDIPVTLHKASGESETYVFNLVAWDDSVHEDMRTAAEAVNITFLACCPPTATVCCGTCPKDGTACTGGTGGCIPTGLPSCP